MLNYNGLWKLLIDRGLKRTQLISLAGVTSNTIAKLGKGQYVPLESLVKICVALNCELGDVVEIVRT